MTRDVLDSDPAQPCHRLAAPDPFEPDQSFHGGVEELWVLAFFFLPTAIDLALLPVTGVHDLYVD